MPQLLGPRDLIARKKAEAEAARQRMVDAELPANKRGREMYEARLAERTVEAARARADEAERARLARDETIRGWSAFRLKVEDECRRADEGRKTALHRQDIEEAIVQQQRLDALKELRRLLPEEVRRLIGTVPYGLAGAEQI